MEPLHVVARTAHHLQIYKALTALVSGPGEGWARTCFHAHSCVDHRAKGMLPLDRPKSCASPWSWKRETPFLSPVDRSWINLMELSYKVTVIRLRGKEKNWAKEDRNTIQEKQQNCLIYTMPFISHSPRLRIGYEMSKPQHLPWRASLPLQGGRNKQKTKMQVQNVLKCWKKRMQTIGTRWKEK